MPVVEHILVALAKSNPPMVEEVMVTVLNVITPVQNPAEGIV
jgi:hypothetical protein